MASKSLRDAEPHIVGADDKWMMKVEGFVRGLSKRVNLSAVDEVGRTVVQPFYGPGKPGSQAGFGIEWIKSSKRLDVGEGKSDHSAARDSMVSAVYGDWRGRGRFDLDRQELLRIAAARRAQVAGETEHEEALGLAQREGEAVVLSVVPGVPAGAPRGE